MSKKEQGRLKMVFIVVFFFLNTLNCFLLTTNIFLKDLSPYPRSIFMVANSFFGDFGLLVVLFSLSILLFKTDYKRYKYLMIVSIVLSFLYIALTVYFGYYRMIFSFYNLKAFDSPGAGDAVGFLLKSLITLIGKAEPFFLLSAVILIVLYIAYVFRNRKNLEFRNSSTVSGIDRLSIGISTLVVGILLMASSYTSYQMEIEGTWHKDNKTPLYGAQTVGLLNYYIFDAYNFFFTDKEVYSQEQIELIKQKLEELKKTQRVSEIDGKTYDNVQENFGVFEGKNLLLIQIESLNNFMIGMKININGEMVEVTPNLNRILEKSVYFNNYYTTVGIGNTSDSEFTNMTSLYAVGTTYSVYEYNNVVYQSLPRLFANKRYQTFSVHANTGLFYERSKLHPLLYGFDYHYAEEDFDITPEQRVHTWLNDYDLLHKTVDIMKEKSADGPVFSFAITISNHMPYDQPTDNGRNQNWFAGKANILPEGYNLSSNNNLNTQLSGYIEHVSYTDYAIGEAMNYLEETGLADNTIVILYGDHGCGFNAYDAIYENPELFENNINDLISYTNTKNQTLLERRMLTNVPFIIYDPAYNPETSPLKAQIISLVRGMSSTSRTISNLFGLEPTYYFGVDALSDAKTFTYSPRNLDIFADGIIISATSKEYIITDSAYNDFYTQSKVDEIINAMLNYKDFNDKVLKYEIFPKI